MERVEIRIGRKTSYGFGSPKGRYFRTLILVLALSPWATVEGDDFGRFVGSVKTEWLRDGRKMKLLEDFAFVDAAGRRWNAPKGSVIDGASIPPSLWSLVGGPYEGTYREASVLHDIACDSKMLDSNTVHRMFYYAMRAGGVDEDRALWMYAAVRKWGPQWRREPRPDGAERGGGFMVVDSFVPPSPSQQQLEELRRQVEVDRTLRTIEQVEALPVK